MRTSCQPPSAFGKQGVRWSAVIHDASSSGLSLVVARRFEPGAGLAVELPGGDGGDSYVVLARVIRAKAQTDGSWLLGCEFISALSDEELGHLSPGARPEAAGPAQGQASLVPGPAREAADPAPDETLSGVFLRVETRPGTYYHCVINRFTVPKSWPPRASQTLTLRGGFRRLPVQLRVEVVTCRRHGERWALWCRLIEGDPAASAAG